MLRQGWIAECRGDDRRERRLSLAKTGEAQLKRALPAWEKVQSQLRRELGEKAWKDLFHLTTRLAELAAESVQ